MLRQMRRNSKAEETKLFEEKRKNIDLQKDLQKAQDELNSFKTESSREATAINREADSLREELASLKAQRESLDGMARLFLFFGSILFCVGCCFWHI